MVESIHFVLVFNDGSSRTFPSKAVAMEYADSLIGIRKPRELVRVSTQTKREKIRKWD